MIVGRSERRRRAKSEARSEGGWGRGDGGMEVAVVSQRPGSWGSVGVGRVEMEVGIGICRENVRCWVRVMWAIREVEMLVYVVAMALASVECLTIC